MKTLALTIILSGLVFSGSAFAAQTQPRPTHCQQQCGGMTCSSHVQKPAQAAGNFDSPEYQPSGG